MQGRLTRLTDVGSVSFVVLYFCAAARYPGGTRVDPASVGYRHFANYWCDLLGPLAYNGAPNPGESLAIAGTLILPLTMLGFWWSVPSLFRAGRALSAFVRAAGTLGMLATALVFTPRHNLVVNVASLLGFAAFVATQLGLWRAGHRRLFAGACLVLAVALCNWLMWQTGLLLRWMPLVQKAAFASFLIWVALVSRRIRASVPLPLLEAGGARRGTERAPRSRRALAERADGVAGD